MERETCYLTAGIGRNHRVCTPLDTIWASFVQRLRMDVPRSEATCSRCRGQNRVQVLRMPDTPWIWFEWENHSPVGPSPTLAFDCPPQRLSYSLRAIIYADGNHFAVTKQEGGGSTMARFRQVFQSLMVSNPKQIFS